MNRLARKRRPAFVAVPEAVACGAFDGAPLRTLALEVARSCRRTDRIRGEDGFFKLQMARLSLAVRWKPRVILLGCQVDTFALRIDRRERWCLLALQVFLEHYFFFDTGWLERHLARAVWQAACELRRYASPQ